MRAYSYKPQDVGLREWPKGVLVLEDFEETLNPNEADIFIFPGILSALRDRTVLDTLPYLKGNETRHVFFDMSESRVVYDKPSLFIRCNLNQEMKVRDPNSIAWPWPVDDFKWCIEPDQMGFKSDVSFHGWNSCDVRASSTESCLQNTSLICDIVRYPNFTGKISDSPELITRRARFRKSMKESRVALCPESIPGDLPYRFFEAMSAGRVPILIASDYVLPFEDVIPYDDFTIFIDRKDAASAGAKIVEYLDKNTDSELLARGRTARSHWEGFLNRDNWHSSMTYAVHKQLLRMQTP